MNPRRCPSPVDLERAFWAGDAELRSHADGCDRCAAEWAEIATLADAARAIVPPPASAERREEMRTTLLAGVGRAPAAAPRRIWPMVAPLAAAAAILLTWWAWPSSPARPLPAPGIATAGGGTVVDHDGARYLRASQPPDEIVRLIDGTLSLQIELRAADQRFRVITGDAELEAVAAAFDVTARADRLVAVRVLHGQVEIRAAGQDARVIHAGETWRADLLGAAEPTPAPAPIAPTPIADPTVAIAPEAPPQAPRRRLAAPAPEPELQVQATPDAAVPTVLRDPAQRAFDAGWTAIRDGDFTAAASSFARAAATTGDDRLAEDASYWRAVALARSGDATAAIRAFDSFLELHPDATRAGEASVMVGWLLFDRGDHAVAARRFRAAIDDPSARVRRSAADGLRAVDDD